MTPILIGLAVLFAIGWLAIQVVTVAVGVASELGKATQSGAGLATNLLARCLADGPPKLECHSSITNANLPRPSNDHVVGRLTAYAQESHSWPLWPHHWLSDPELRGAPQAHLYAEDIASLQVTPLASLPPYDLADEAPVFPEAPAEPQAATMVNEEYPIPTIALPKSRIPLELLDRIVRYACSEFEGVHKDHLARHEELVASAKALNVARREAAEAALKTYKRNLTKYALEKVRYYREREEFIRPLKSIKSSLAKGMYRDASLQHFDLVLRAARLPAFVPRQWRIDYDPDTRTLLVEHRYPAVADAEILHRAQGKKAVLIKRVSKSTRKELIAQLQASLSLALARLLAESDSFNLLDAVAVNGWVEFFDKATGHRVEAYCCHLVCAKDQVLSMALATADPVTAFSRLSGALAAESYEVAPTRPNLILAKDDVRFVAARETLVALPETQNLASMPWDDFEHLVRELFERKFGIEGAEVKITRASRDHGVDAIIFDSDPIRGGKIVVQAKRYTIPVDVSAVRDLYGTVVNEGANSGMLVTTSSFGPDAYAFAQNKPLKLFNGPQLLGLLQEVGFKFRIDEPVRNFVCGA